jgi:peptidyl-prolyl cis-trans isomerase SurA
MRPTTRTKALPALALATALLLGACSGGTDAAPGSDGTAADTATSTQPAGDEASSTLDVGALPDPVAEVNGEDISRDVFLAAFEGQREVAQQQAEASGVPANETVLRDRVVDQLVDAELLLQEGDRLELTAGEEEVDAELADLVEQSGAGSQEELMTLLEQQGLDEGQVRDELGRIVLIDKLLQERGGVEQPGEQEVRDFYDELTRQGADGASSTADPSYPPFEEVRDQLEEQLVRQNENTALGELLADLRADAEITVHV